MKLDQHVITAMNCFPNDYTPMPESAFADCKSGLDVLYAKDMVEATLEGTYVLSEKGIVLRRGRFGY